ncbi:MAG: hypothetical protein WC741_00615 [Patescibacteria group bacterium]|jgi:hypothetical protein
MDVFTILSYLNKVSLIAFFITTAVVAYQIYNFKKEKTKEQTPSIPDFKDNNNFAVASNYTNLPSSLTKKQTKSVNYSKSIFLTISLLTVIIVIFVVSLIKKNSAVPDQALKNSSVKATATPSIIKPTVMPTPITQKNLTPTPTKVAPTAVVPTEIAPTEILPTNTTPTVAAEIVLANNPSVTPAESPTGSLTEAPASQPQVLPETGSVGKVLLIIGAAVSTIFFSFFL